MIAKQQKAFFIFFRKTAAPYSDLCSQINLTSDSKDPSLAGTSEAARKESKE